jgi:uncharacterized protein YbbC (DUF1343 family)/CubicO group peptidase (beta-lactamase class C family)
MRRKVRARLTSGPWLALWLGTYTALAHAQLKDATPPGREMGSHPPAPTAREPDATGTLPEVDALVHAAILEHKLPGAVVAIGHADGLAFLHAYGQRALIPATEAMTTDTIFDLASLTKPVVAATLLMQLVEQGRVKLDASASDYLPELRGRDKQGIRVQDLLLHTSGLPAEDPLSDYAAGKSAALAKICALRLRSKPGERFAYSDLGYILLGAIIERVAGESLDVLAARTIFEPLAMHDTRFNPPQRWHARIAPTEVPDDVRRRIDPKARSEVVIRGDVHDPRALCLGGVAGNAGLFSSAEDLARYARMLLSLGELEGARVLRPESVAALRAPHFIGEVTRGLGWDERSEYSGLRGHELSHLAFGHGGFTGTSLWIDPDQDLFVILLSNRVHPDGKGYVIRLAGAIADVAARHHGRRPYPASCKRFEGGVRAGIDVLREQAFAPVANKRLGLVYNRASLARDGSRTIDALAADKHVQLVALFTPEHGQDARLEGSVSDGRDQATGLPVYSLYGKTRRPTAQMLQGLDAIVFDLQDVGTRYFTYLSTLRQVLEAAAAHGVEVIVLDRPNPIGAQRVEGPVLDAHIDTFVNYHALPVTHGMAAGEIALLLNDERNIHARLTVVAMQGYRRELSFEQTGLRWTDPSPNLRGARAAWLYPATGLLESTNLSVGRGTDQPFGLFGAPWLNAARVAGDLRALQLSGLSFTPVDFTPTADRYAGQLCHGVRVEVTDAAALRPVHTGVTIAHELVSAQGGAFETRRLGELLGNASALAALCAKASVGDVERLWERDLQRFELRRARHLLYGSCGIAGALPAGSR